MVNQEANLSANKGRPPGRERPQDKIQKSNNDDKCWNKLLWGTGFPRRQSKNPCRSSLFCRGEARCLTVGFKSASKPVIHRNSSQAEQVSSWAERRSMKVVFIHLPVDIRLLTPGSRRYVHKPQSYSEDRFNSLFSQVA